MSTTNSGVCTGTTTASITGSSARPRRARVTIVAVGVVAAVAAAAIRLNHLWMPVLMVGVGALHGQAHGAEIPVGATPGGYVAGFLVSTAGLLVVGTAAGLALRRAPVLRIAVGSVMSVAGAWMLLGA